MPSPYSVQRSGRLVGFTRQQRRELDLLRAGGDHLVADDRLDPGAHPEAERQPGEDPRGLATDVPGADEQLVARHLGVGGVVAERAEEEMREPCDHGASLVAAGRRRGFPAVSPPLGASRAVRHGARFAGRCGTSRCVRACRLAPGDQPRGHSRSPHHAEGMRVEQPHRPSGPFPGASRASRASRSKAARCEVRWPVRHQPLRARLQAHTGRSTRHGSAKHAPCRPALARSADTARRRTGGPVPAGTGPPVGRVVAPTAP